MSVEVTDEEYWKLCEEASAEAAEWNDDIFNADVQDWLIEKIKKKGRIDIGSYIPMLHYGK